MKKYVLFTPTVSNMGGGQMYVCNKILYYRNKGWNTLVIAGHGNNILLPELRQCKEIFYELNFFTYMFSRRKQDSVRNKIAKLICDKTYDEIIIESTSLTACTWAETVSSVVNAKHIVYLLQERNDIDNKGLLELLIFKHKRREIAGITDKTLPKMFDIYYAIDNDKAFKLPAKCNNVMADVDHPLLHEIDKTQQDFIIGCLSRLDKPFFLSALDDFCEYVKGSPSKKFLLILMGDVSHNNVLADKIEKAIQQTTNVNYVITGYLYPVPTRLLELCDAFFSSAGSSQVCMYSGIPTIVYDANDYKPIGILGRTTKQTLFRDNNQPPQSFKMLMDDILINKVYPVLAPDYSPTFPDFSAHVDFVSNSEPSFLYYPINDLKNETKTEKMVSRVLFFIGAKLYVDLRGYKISKWIKHKFAE